MSTCNNPSVKIRTIDLNGSLHSVMMRCTPTDVRRLAYDSHALHCFRTRSRLVSPGPCPGSVPGDLPCERGGAKRLHVAVAWTRALHQSFAARHGDRAAAGHGALRQI